MSFFTTASARQINIGLTILRSVTGLIFIAHGAQKLFVFGIAGVSAGFGQMGIPMPEIVGPFIALVELFGGLALITGMLTRLASAGLASTMVVAILLVHLKSGFFAPTGIEFPLSLLGSTLMLAITGAGAWSLDALMEGRNARADTVPRAERLRRAA